MHNYLLCLLFVKSGMAVRPKSLRSDMVTSPKSLRSRPKRLTTMSDPRLGQIKKFQKHDWTAKTNNVSFKQDFSFIYSRTYANSFLFVQLIL